ncbi:CU044_5270 family protein [Kibdelosporangium phytohabitans]|uniref:Uncharacterized protein n=1 Tax=Kibdelosporangium phytohabitans TaxID=860235 RepID=A0A0N9I6V9_9PSEU|nr:CU044_5270 family protein [Kibdelosporangium phytohabitans]ALG10648.1 hypothetical protein AOZ06_30470 [Kibdelosporangium phytohabitans]MBE1461768.1 hypothetical protein [Kibdelosporangium phytohabitans]
MTDEDFLAPLLTRALTDLHDVEPDERALRKARADLMEAVARAAPVRRRRHWGRWVAAAAVLVVLVPGGLVASTFTQAPRYASAADVLIKAADEIKNVDFVLAPGQYLYSRGHGWHLVELGSARRTYLYIDERTVELWIPADPRQEWMGRYPGNGQRTWIHGTEAEARADGLLDGDFDNAAGPEVRAPCGDWGAAQAGRKPCEGLGGWTGPQPPEFYEKLPTDPRQLYDLLRKETAGRGQHPDVQMLVQSLYVIGAPQVPARIRGTFYRALALMPSLRITEQSSTLDGEVGVAIGVDGGVARMEVIVDPETGRYIGQRQWTDGRLHTTDSVSVGVVDGMGMRLS